MVNEFQNQVLQQLQTKTTVIKDIKCKMDAVYEQAADLTEFRTTTLSTLHEIRESQKSLIEIVGEHEVQIRNFRRRPI